MITRLSGMTTHCNTTAYVIFGNLKPSSTTFRNFRYPATIMGSKRRGGELKDLSLHDLPAALEFAITSQGSAELALLFLIENYDFNLDALKGRLQGSYCFRLAI
jgi:hypothetical protein